MVRVKDQPSKYDTAAKEAYTPGSNRASKRSSKDSRDWYKNPSGMQGIPKPIISARPYKKFEDLKNVKELKDMLEMPSPKSIAPLSPKREK